MDTEKQFTKLLLKPGDPKAAVKMLTDSLFNYLYPLMLKIRKDLQKYKGNAIDEVSKLKDAFALCTSQIKKCLQTMFDIFKTEHHKGILLQDSRQCASERLSWCVDKLNRIDQQLDNLEHSNTDQNDSMFVTPMFFVNWIDHTFEALAKLAELVYKTDYKESGKLCHEWKSEIVDCLHTLHVSLDELLLSAMTLCKYCLQCDQHIVKTRCQVVLRESKALLSELIHGDLGTSFKITAECLKLPIMPSNINVLIDVLKDVLYVLETNTNTALLALVVNCFSQTQSPVDILTKHFTNMDGTCSCIQKSSNEPTEDCSFVKAFDLYNERLLQIGSFAVSCSSDQSRILSLRSGLASLEAFDPYLVPALVLSPESYNSKLLTDSWRQEVQEIRDSIFLIVDPAAFAEKSKEMMHVMLLDFLKEATYDNNSACSIINIGSVVYEFFAVYNEFEPEALTEREKLQPLLKDLNKVQIECKIVSNMLCTGDDVVYTLKNSQKKNSGEVTINQLFKRLKLLYTVVSRINSVLHPRENEELFDCENEDEHVVKNVTHTVLQKNKEMLTYIQSPKKPVNLSRSVFARTTNVSSFTNNFPLKKWTKAMKAFQGEELSFSVKLDELFNISESNGTKLHDNNVVANIPLDYKREPSIMYYSPKKRASLRKAVLNKHSKLICEKGTAMKDFDVDGNSVLSDKGSLINEATSLQITDILNQMSDMSNTFVVKKPLNFNATFVHSNTSRAERLNVLRINVNSNKKSSTTKHVWNIPVISNTLQLDDSGTTTGSNVTQPSNVTTFERLSDIDLVESKLNSLKTLDLETSV